MSYASDLFVRRKAWRCDSSLLTSLLDVKQDVDVFLASDLIVRRKARWFLASDLVVRHKARCDWHWATILTAVTLSQCSTVMCQPSAVMRYHFYWYILMQMMMAFFREWLCCLWRKLLMTHKYASQCFKMILTILSSWCHWWCRPLSPDADEEYPC